MEALWDGLGNGLFAPKGEQLAFPCKHPAFEVQQFNKQGELPLGAYSIRTDLFAAESRGAHAGSAHF